MGDTAVEILVRTFVIGVIVAAPVGAMAILAIQRTLAHGWRGGLATGAGIATADAGYAALAAFALAGCLSSNKGDSGSQTTAATGASTSATSSTGAGRVTSTLARTARRIASKSMPTARPPDNAVGRGPPTSESKSPRHHETNVETVPGGSPSSARPSLR